MMSPLAAPAGDENHVGGCTRFLRCLVKAATHICWKNKVFTEMRDMLEENNFVIESNVIEEYEMLMQLTHIAYVGHDRQAKLLGHYADRNELTDTCQPGAIRLDKMYAFVVEE